MGASSEAISGLLGRVFRLKLLQLVVISIVALAICGAVSERRLAAVLVLFVLARGSSIAREALRENRTDADWEALYSERFHAFECSDAKKRSRAALALGLPESAGPSQLARFAVESTRNAYKPPRTRRELTCEAAGLLAFGLLIPIDIVLWSRDFISSTPEQGWLAPLVVALGFLLYGLPFYARQLKVNPELRALWWGLPFLPALLLVFYGIAVKHPYLDPTRDDRSKLAADKVLSHRDNITASKNAGWVLDYARELEARGETQQARHYYRAGLQLAPRRGSHHREFKESTTSDDEVNSR